LAGGQIRMYGLAGRRSYREQTQKFAIHRPPPLAGELAGGMVRWQALGMYISSGAVSSTGGKQWACTVRRVRWQALGMYISSGAVASTGHVRTFRRVRWQCMPIGAWRSIHEFWLEACTFGRMPIRSALGSATHLSLFLPHRLARGRAS